jgi:hypothetical protein
MLALDRDSHPPFVADGQPVAMPPTGDAKGLGTPEHDAAPRKRRGPRCPRAPALAGLLALVTIAVLATTASAGAGGALPGRVTVIGDSVATGMQWNRAAVAALGRGIDLRLQVAVCRRLTGASCPFEGQRAPTLVDVVADEGPGLGPVVILIMGYNDYQQSFASSVESAVRALVDAGVERIYWATLATARRPYVDMNATLWAAAAGHPELTIVDWNAHSRGRPDWFQNDGLHLTPAGGLALAEFLRTALARGGASRTIELRLSDLPRAVVGRAYARTLEARGGTSPYRWAVAWGTPPPGLRLTPDGRLIGRPARAGRFPVVLRVTDGTGAVVVRRVVLVARASPRV